MYFRPTGQTIAGEAEAAGRADFPEPGEQLPPMVAILDGAQRPTRRAARPDLDRRRLRPGGSLSARRTAAWLVDGLISYSAWRSTDGGTPLVGRSITCRCCNPDEQARRVGRHYEHVPTRPSSKIGSNARCGGCLVGDGESGGAGATRQDHQRLDWRSRSAVIHSAEPASEDCWTTCPGSTVYCSASARATTRSD